ncbi:MAG: aldolase [Pseudonocardiales bacterium]|nr:aldolase [Actinomycetota bacterium]PZS13406.1 MAG: aldolase [Pseudonocardiales bacterium]
MTLDPRVADRLSARLAADDAARQDRYPGVAAQRQPVHTVYVPADQLTAGIVGVWGAAALAALDAHGPLPCADGGRDDEVDALVRDKLATEPIEDLRIDFEDGYGSPSSAVEDVDARAAARALARDVADGVAPRFTGIRMKSLDRPSRRRGIRTLDLFLDTLLAAGSLPAGFRVTLPKVTSVDQVEAMVELCFALDAEYGLPALRFELQVETPQAILGADGTVLVARMIHAAAGRCAGLHYGTYDYSGSIEIAAAYQSMEHPAADYAKAVMQVAAAGTGVPVCDGSTNVLPVGDAEQVRAAWALHARLVRRSLERGFYQGWDLHPAQLPTRFAATFGFYRSGLSDAAGRLLAYRERRCLGVLDEPATAKALARFLLRAVECGAAELGEVSAQAGVTPTELTDFAAART